jgi:peroxiredoxin
MKLKKLMKKETIVAIIILILAVAGIIALSTLTKDSPNEYATPVTEGGSAQSANFTAPSQLVGKELPNFVLADATGVKHSPESLKGHKAVLFFNEGLMCYPSCWEQMVAFARDTRLEKAGVMVLSIVPESYSAWQTAVKKMPELSGVPTLFDEDRSVSAKFGMLNADSSMHPGELPGHTYVIIDEEGIVRYVLDDPSMRINNDRIINELNKLN